MRFLNCHKTLDVSQDPCNTTFVHFFLIIMTLTPERFAEIEGIFEKETTQDDSFSIKVSAIEDHQTPIDILYKLAGLPYPFVDENERQEYKKIKYPVVEVNETNERKYKSNCNHIVEECDNQVVMYNDDDGFYREYFNSREEIMILIAKLQDAADKVFPPVTV